MRAALDDCLITHTDPRADCRRLTEVERGAGHGTLRGAGLEDEIHQIRVYFAPRTTLAKTPLSRTNTIESGVFRRWRPSSIGELRFDGGARPTSSFFVPFVTFCKSDCCL